jgi:hypothetical protein
MVIFLIAETGTPSFPASWAIARLWSKALRLERLPDDTRRAAVIWGPLVLAGDLGAQPRRADGDGDGPLTTTAPPESPIIVTERSVAEWVQPVDRSAGTFRTVGVGAELTLAPFYKTHRRIYTGYWDVLTPAENEARLKEIAAERERLRRLEELTLVYFQPTDATVEKAHNQQGEETSIVRTSARPGRRATKWFSYDLPLSPTLPGTLVITYNRDNRRARAFEILVDGEPLAQEKFDFDSESRFFDREYPLPSSLVAGKQRITVRFQATGPLEIAPVYALRLIR